MLMIQAKGKKTKMNKTNIKNLIEHLLKSSSTDSPFYVQKIIMLAYGLSREEAYELMGEIKPDVYK